MVELMKLSKNISHYFAKDHDYLFISIHSNNVNLVTVTINDSKEGIYAIQIVEERSCVLLV